MKTEMKMFASLPLYVVTTLFAFGCVSALPRVYQQVPRMVPSVPKQYPGILRSVPKLDTRSANALSTFNSRSEDCPRFWDPFGDYCYMSRGVHNSWEEARAHCKELEADLVTINSAEENDYLLSMTKMEEIQKIWIGLKSGYYWDDSTLPEYENWASGEPKGQASKPCVFMDGTDKPQGFWKAGLCTPGEPIGTVCKRLP